MNAAAVGAVTSRYPLPHTQEPDYAAILRTLGYQTRGIFERLRDLFNGRAYIQLSLDLIASRIGCSRGLLISVLQELENLGLLKVYRQRIGPRRNEVNRYVLPEALIHPSFTVQPMNPAPRLTIHQEGRQATTEVHVMNFPRARESVRQEDGFLPSTASTESESERRKEELKKKTDHHLLHPPRILSLKAKKPTKRSCWQKRASTRATIKNCWLTRWRTCSARLSWPENTLTKASMATL